MKKEFDHHLNLIKWIGIITMTIDHIGYFLFPQVTWLRLIGRLAFPCFLYSTIEGTKRTRHYARYISRMLVAAIISMPISPNTINVIFLLVCFSLSLKYQRWVVLFGFLSLFAEYSIYGFLFGWAIYWFKEKDQKQGTLLSIAVQFVYGLSLQSYSLFALLFFSMKTRMRLPKLPRYFFYMYYPLHQLLLIWLTRL